MLLDTPRYKVKRITVLPGARLSCQKHARRHEHWCVASGEAVVTVDGVECRLGPGGATDIRAGSTHRVHNPSQGPLAIIEVQTGDYFGEDDIVRLEDDYGRAGDGV